MRLGKLNLSYDDYTVTFVTVPVSKEMIRYVLVESPMEHDYFRRLQALLCNIGISLPIDSLANCGMSEVSISHTRSARRWKNKVDDLTLQRYTKVIHKADSTLSKAFKGLLSFPDIRCSVIGYDDGYILLEVRRVIDWSAVNHFESSL